MAACKDFQPKNQLMPRCFEMKTKPPKSPVVAKSESPKFQSARGRWSHLSRTLDVKNLIQQVLEMSSQYNYVVSVISKAPTQRQESECTELVGWFKSRVRKIFTNLKTETIADVIRNCKFERKKPNELIIKQGEIGEQMFIVLKGSMSVYVQDLINDAEQLKAINSICKRGRFLDDRSVLGEYRANTGTSAVVGEIALIKKDCVRTASVVVDEDTDLVIIDRELYNRSVRETLERDYIEKRNFVIDNPIFKELAAKNKRQLIICLKKETYHFGNVIVRQGTTIDKTFFILHGEIEIGINSETTKSQYKSSYEEMKFLLPQLLTTNKTQSNKEVKVFFKNHSNSRQLCLLGDNEHIGLMEQALGLSTYIETATTTRTSHLMVLEKQYENLLLRRSGPKSYESKNLFLEASFFRLSLYAHRSHLAETSAIFRYFMLKLKDEPLLFEFRKQKALEATWKQKCQQPSKHHPPHSKESDNKEEEEDKRIGISNLRLSRLKRKRLPETFEKLLQRQNTEKIILNHVREICMKRLDSIGEGMKS